jgi:hypothetical protein
MVQQARDGGMALLCIDLPEPVRTSDNEACAGPETAIVAAIDFLCERAGVDAGRIAVVADGTLSSAVAKGVALDGRPAAAVCDGGVLQMWEDEVAAGPEAAEAIEPIALLRRIRCPTMIFTNPKDGLHPDYIRRLLARSGKQNFDLREFRPTGPDEEPPEARPAKMMFEWLCEQLKANRSADGAAR